MLPQLNRIRKKKDFEFIYKNSKSFRNNLFILKVSKNNLNVARFGLVVSQKISKKATIRNKVRRRLSDVARDLNKKIMKDVDLVFIALPGIDKKEFYEIKDAINNLLIQLKLVNVD